MYVCMYVCMYVDVPEWIGWGLFSLNGDSYKGILGWYLLKSTKYLGSEIAFQVK